MKFKFFAFIAASILLAACASKAPEAAAGSPTASADSTGAEQQSFAMEVSADSPAASGVVMPAQEVKLAFTVSGTIKSINAAEGQQVKAGDLLASLDDTTILIDLSNAERALKELTSPAAKAGAAQALATARQALEDEQENVDALAYKRASDTKIDNLQGQIDLAEDTLARAQKNYKNFARKEDGDSGKASALVAMTNAQLRLNDLNAQMNWFTGKPSDIDVAQQQADLEAAKAAVQEAEWYLAQLNDETLPAEATGANLAKLESARNNLALIRDRLAKTQLASPIDGTIIEANALAGESAAPGQTIFSISNVTDLHVETSDLNEKDVPRVQVGQAVTVYVDALNLEIPGKVVRISPVATVQGGDAVYKTVIALDEIPAGLLAGMNVDVIYK